MNESRQNIDISEDPVIMIKGHKITTQFVELVDEHFGDSDSRRAMQDMLMEIQTGSMVVARMNYQSEYCKENIAEIGIAVKRWYDFLRQLDQLHMDDWF